MFVLEFCGFPNCLGVGKFKDCKLSCCLERPVWMRPCHFFLSRLPVSPMYNFATSASYAIDHIGGGARKVIFDLNGSLGSRHFLYIINERTSFASWASAFESSKLVIDLKWTSDQKRERRLLISYLSKTEVFALKCCQPSKTTFIYEKLQRNYWYSASDSTWNGCRPLRGGRMGRILPTLGTNQIAGYI